MYYTFLAPKSAFLHDPLRNSYESHSMRMGTFNTWNHYETIYIDREMLGAQFLTIKTRRCGHARGIILMSQHLFIKMSHFRRDPLKRYHA